MLIQVIQTFCLRSWWVIAFLLACFLVYEQESKTVYQEYQRLKSLQQQLEWTKVQALQRRKELQWQIQSQSDPKWMELALKRGLGLVPENQTKIYFAPSAMNR
jgi:hypothetical protein